MGNKINETNSNFKCQDITVTVVYVGEFGERVKNELSTISGENCYYNVKEILIKSENESDFGKNIENIERTIRESYMTIITICGDVDNSCDKAIIEKFAQHMNDKVELLYGFIAQSEGENNCEILHLENFAKYQGDFQTQKSLSDFSKLILAFESIFFDCPLFCFDTLYLLDFLKNKKGTAHIIQGGTTEEFDSKIKDVVLKSEYKDKDKECFVLMQFYNEDNLDNVFEIGDCVRKHITKIVPNETIIPQIVSADCCCGKELVLYILQEDNARYKKIFPAYNIYTGAKIDNLALKNQRYICIEIETSGIDIESDEIIMISAVELLNGKMHGIFKTFVKPKKEISSLITEITEVTNDQLENAPNIVEAISDFKAFCGNSILVGHNINRFDLKFLNAEAEKCGLEAFKNEVIDTLDIAKRNVKDVANYKLATLCEKFAIENYKGEINCVDIATGERMYSNGKDYAILSCELFAKLYIKEVKVGIFWALPDGIFQRHQIVKLKSSDLSYSDKKTGKIDSDFGHDIVWNEIFGVKDNIDFATYPRGRVLYDWVNAKHIIFVDECVTNGEIQEIVKIFDIKDYSIEYDEHYRCDGCLEF
ncbi:MAG: exonuclease domain-containing protein [Bacillota bacterium]